MPEQPKFSYAQIAKMIDTSRTTNDLDTVVSLIEGFPLDQTADLNKLALAKLEEIETPTAGAKSTKKKSAESNQTTQTKEQPTVSKETTPTQASDNVKAPAKAEKEERQAEVLEPEKPQSIAATVRDTLASRMPQIQTLLPKHITAERFMRIVFMAIQKDPKLLECSRNSLVSAMLKAAEWGLIPDGRQGALIAFNNKVKDGNREYWELQATFLPMYQGLMDLARRSGQIADIFPATVCENDEFEYELGLNRMLKHKPLLTGDRGKPVCYYCVIELKDGTKTFGPGPMTVEGVEAIRKRSKSPNSPAWKNDFEAMAWKTVIKRNLKFGPQSAELADAIEADNEAEYRGDLETIDLGDTNEPTGANELNQRLLEG